MANEWSPPSHTVTSRGMLLFLLYVTLFALFCFVVVILLFYLRPDFNGQQPDWTKLPKDRLYVSYTQEHLTWFRGNLHAHSTLSDGSLPPELLVKEYADRDYDFLTLSDCVPPILYQQYDNPKVLILPGYEISGNVLYLQSENLNRLGLVPPRLFSRQRIVVDLTVFGGYGIMCDPNRRSFGIPHYTTFELKMIKGYHGIEIFSGSGLDAPGSAYASDCWDTVLSQGRVVWGHACDNSRRLDQIGRGWDMIQAKKLDNQEIVNAYRKGRFYASTGVMVDSIHVDGFYVHIVAKNAREFRVIADGGRIIAVQQGKELNFTAAPQDGFKYIRVECSGEKDIRAWLQPFLFPPK